MGQINKDVKNREVLQKWIVPIKRDEKTAKILEKTRQTIAAIHSIPQAQANTRGRVINRPIGQTENKPNL